MPDTNNRIPVATVSAKAEKSLQRRHPWVFSGALLKEDPSAPAGGTVAVADAAGRLLGRGAYSPRSQIRIRMWSFEEEEIIGPGFFHHRLLNAIEARRRMPLLSPCTARRLVNAESDGLPGLIVDQYEDFAVCQFLSAGAEFWKSVVVAELQRLLPVRGIYERSDADVRAKEGLPPQTGVLWGAAPPRHLEITQGSLRLLVDIANGHKTGLYLDQRENQALTARFAQGADVLNCFSYTGAFGLWALRGGAQSVTQVDASEEVLSLARGNAQLNGLKMDLCDCVHGNAFELLRRYRDERRSFDLIVLDPPKFVSSAGQMKRGCRGYKDINLLAFKLLRPGGVLMTFSCSGLVDAMLFQKIVADAAVDAGRTTRLILGLQQAADHPVALNFPEGRYLKGLVCTVE
jgi:23S rRNA (cytosine1962-C5)-methyltransferase